MLKDGCGGRRRLSDRIEAVHKGLGMDKPRIERIKRIESVKSVKSVAYPIPNLEIAAGFEIRTIGAHQFAFLLIEVRPAIRAGPFDLFDL